MKTKIGTSRYKRWEIATQSPFRQGAHAMLITFSSSTAGAILMFADTAHRLFEIIGKEGTARGAFTKEQLPDAIEKLQQAIASETSEVNQNPAFDKEGNGTPKIGLAARAHSFIEMLTRTRTEDGYITWLAAEKF